jgi:signal transduction histidine kinase
LHTSQNIDSTSYYLKNVELYKISDSKKLNQLNKAFFYLKKKENNLKNRNDLADITFLYFKLSQSDKFNEASKILYKNSLEVKDTINLGKAYRCRAIYYNNNQILDSSFIFYLKAEKIYLKLKDKANYANILLNKGIIQYSIGDYLGSELSLNKAYNRFKELNNTEKIYGTLNQLGLVSNELKEYDKAIFYHKKAIEVIQDFSSIDDKKYYQSVCYNNIGYLYLKSKNFQKAKFYFQEALKNTSIINDDPLLYTNLIDNLAYSKLQTKSFEDIQELFFKALEIRKKINNTTAVVGSYIHISEFYQKKNNNIFAIKYSNLALKTSKESKVPANLVLALKQASIVDVKNASKYSSEYIRVSDSLQIAERNSRDRFARISLETDEIIKQKDDLEDRNRKLLYIFLISFVVAGLLFIVRAQRAKTRELMFKQAQQKANEDIYNLMIAQQSVIDESRTKEKKRLAQDLHDGILGRMFGLRLGLDSLNASNDPEAPQRRLELLNELKNIEQDIREISHDLNREKQVLINNFVSIVHNLLEEQKTLHSAKITYTIDDDIAWDKIANNIKINLYRILQEALQNINKYAQAKNIRVEIIADQENVYLKVIDDGIGFDVSKKSKGIGMQNMISRTNDCQGIIDVHSKKDEGTKIIITVPKESKPQNNEQK